MKTNKLIFAAIAAFLICLSSCVVGVREHPYGGYYHHHHHHYHHDEIILGQKADSTAYQNQAQR